MRKEIADLRAKYQSLEGEVNASIGKKEDEIKALKADIKALNAKKEEEIKAATMKKDREIRSLSRHYKEAASESSKKDVLLAEKDVRLRELNRLFKDMNEEQDVLFERYNQELEQIAQAARGGSGGANSGEQDLFKLLSESKAEQGRLKREIGYYFLSLTEGYGY